MDLLQIRAPWTEIWCYHYKIAIVNQWCAGSDHQNISQYYIRGDQTYYEHMLRGLQSGIGETESCRRYVMPLSILQGPIALAKLEEQFKKGDSLCELVHKASVR